MKATRFLSLLLLCFSLSGISPSYGQSPTDDVWVAVRFADQGVGQGADEYYGTVERKDLDGLSGATPNTFLKLEHGLVMADAKFVPLSQATADAANYGYGAVIYIRVDTIFRIVELDDKFVKDQHLDAQAPKPN